LKNKEKSRIKRNSELTLNQMNEFNVVADLILSKNGTIEFRVLSQRGERRRERYRERERERERRNFAEREKLTGEMEKTICRD
jgi:hypothetical protein